MKKRYRGVRLNATIEVANEEEWARRKKTLDALDAMHDPTSEEIAGHKELIANITHTPAWSGAVKSVKA